MLPKLDCLNHCNAYSDSLSSVPAVVFVVFPTNNSTARSAATHSTAVCQAGDGLRGPKGSRLTDGAVAWGNPHSPRCAPLTSHVWSRTRARHARIAWHSHTDADVPTHMRTHIFLASDKLKPCARPATRCKRATRSKATDTPCRLRSTHQRARREYTAPMCPHAHSYTSAV
jgi:hypothetical protein